LSSSCDDIRRGNSITEGFPMNNKFLGYLIAGTLSATLALAPPVLARGGGGMGGGMHGGGMGGGMHAMGGGGMHFGGMGGGPRFSGARFASAPFAAHAAFSPRFSHPGFAPRFSRFAFHDRFHNRFFHHRFHRFAFIGVPFAYAAYDDCWRRVWTRYGLQYVNVCGDYGY
jgi:hypothetical protein